MIPENASDARERQQRLQQLRRDQISEDSIQTLIDHIEQIEQDDPELAGALREIAHILTGDDRFDTQT